MSTTATPSAATRSDQPAPQPYRLRWVVLFVVMIANVMDAMDSTIATIAGPRPLLCGGSPAGTARRVGR
jgi:hypothetical protein